MSSPRFHPSLGWTHDMIFFKLYRYIKISKKFYFLWDTMQRIYSFMTIQFFIYIFFKSYVPLKRPFKTGGDTLSFIFAWRMVSKKKYWLHIYIYFLIDKQLVTKKRLEGYFRYMSLFFFNEIHSSRSIGHGTCDRYLSSYERYHSIFIFCFPNELRSIHR